MPRKPKRPCRHPGCPRLSDRSYCSTHQQERTRDYNRTQRPTKKLYNSARWQKLRKHVLNQQPLCVRCEHAGALTTATVVDHVTPHNGDKALFFAEWNLQPLCKPCHDRKTATEDGRWGRGKLYTY